MRDGPQPQRRRCSQEERSSPYAETSRATARRVHWRSMVAPRPGAVIRFRPSAYDRALTAEAETRSASDFRCPGPGCLIDVSRTDLSPGQERVHILCGCASWSASCCHRRPPCDDLHFWRWSLSRLVCRAMGAAAAPTAEPGRPEAAAATRAEPAVRLVVPVGTPRAVRGASTTSVSPRDRAAGRSAPCAAAGSRAATGTTVRLPAWSGAAPRPRADTEVEALREVEVVRTLPEAREEGAGHRLVSPTVWLAPPRTSAAPSSARAHATR